MALYQNPNFPGGSGVKNLPANAGDRGLLPGLGRSPEEENGNPLQYSCLGNPMDRGAWPATVNRVTKSEMTKYTRAAKPQYDALKGGEREPLHWRNDH